MKKMKKKNLILLTLLLVAIIIILVATLVVKDNSRSKNQQERLSKYLEKKAKYFYEEIYYPQLPNMVDEVDTFLQNFETTGISLSINVLIEQNTIIEKEAKENMVNKDNNTPCDFDNTKAIIYPKTPYDKDSYNIEVRLDCNLINE
ncbi:MAG: hypothetical protein PUB18_02015 [bacterium]|nr:hypothetical protein [bacterium]